MEPVTTAALITAGAAIAGGGVNAASTSKMNKKSMAFSRQMYDRQRSDQLNDWNRVNDYNSPQAQMKRLQDAGLNPNLVYGQGSGGGGSASPVPATDVQNPQFRTPEWGGAISAGGLAGINAYYDLEIKQAQINNLKSQNTVIEQEALLKAAQTAATGTGEESTRFKLDFEKDLRDVSADSRREQLRQTKTSTDLSFNKDAREAAINSSNVTEAAQRMLNLHEQRLTAQIERTRTRVDIQRLIAEKSRIRESVVQMQKDGRLKDLDIELREKGINPQDPMWARIVARILGNFFDSDGSPK